jgi:hypothetical protein
MWNFFNSNKEILRDLREIKRLIMGLKEELAALAVQVTANTEVDQSAIILIQGIAAKLNELYADPVAVKDLATKLKASADALAAAVVANTPVENI